MAPEIIVQWQVYIDSQLLYPGSQTAFCSELNRICFLLVGQNETFEDSLKHLALCLYML